MSVQGSSTPVRGHDASALVAPFASPPPKQDRSFGTHSGSELPLKRPTPDSRDLTRTSCKKVPSFVGEKVQQQLHAMSARKAPATGKGQRYKPRSSVGSTTSLPGQSQLSARPTPDAHAFLRPGECRPKKHTPLSLVGVTPHRKMCPPTPRRSMLSTRKTLDTSFRKTRQTGRRLGETPLGIRAADSPAELLYCSPKRQALLNKSPFQSSKSLEYGDVPEIAYIEVVGEGTFGKVSIVLDRETGQHYALKENKIPFESPKSKSYMQFEKTTQAWAELEPHRNLVEIVCAWFELGHIKVQMELCRGGNLLQYVDYRMGGDKRELWEEKEIWRCLGDAAAGLEHLHRAGLCHNDIKPENMFLGGDGQNELSRRLMLGDFGIISKDKAVLEEDGDFKYMSKEAVKGKRTSKAADIFSLGISFFEVVADVDLPETGEWHKIREGEVPRFEDRLSNNQLYDLLCEMMHRTPGRRPSASAILAHEEVQRHRTTPLHVHNLLEIPVQSPRESRNATRTPEPGTSVFVTTPLAESLEQDVESNGRAYPSTFRTPDQNSRREGARRSSTDETSDQASMPSPRKCLLFDFDDFNEEVLLDEEEGRTRRTRN